MRFLSISAALAFVLSVNASTLNKRDVTAATQTCITDLDAITPQIQVCMDSTRNFTSAQGYSGALVIQSQVSTLQTKVKTAATSCCATVDIISDEDSLALLASVDTVVAKSLENIDVVTVKKPEIDNLALATSLALSDLKTLHTDAVTISDCILAITPSAELASAQGYADQLENAFQDVITLYSVTNTTNDTNSNPDVITAETQTCINDLDALNPQIQVCTDGVNNYTVSQGYAGALTIQAKITTLQTKLNTATASCCSIPSTIGDKGSLALLASADTVVANSLDSINTAIAKKPEFDQLALSVSLALGDLKNFHTNASVTSNCIVGIIASAELATAQGYADQLENAFQEAITLYSTTNSTTNGTTSTDALTDAASALAAEVATA